MRPAPSAFDLRAFTMSDYDAALALWQASAGVQLRDADSPEAMARYLARNPGLSYVAIQHEGGQLIGTILAGHDGRRGYLQHLAVDEHHRHHGIATALVNAALKALHHEGICKVHVFVQQDNAAALTFWRARRFVTRSEIALLSHTSTDNPNA